MEKEKQIYPPKFYENFKEMNNRCVHYRGAYIHLSTLIESLINLIIVNYFTSHHKEKSEELLYSVFASERITLAHKIEVVRFIYRQHFKEFDDKHNNDILNKFKNRAKEEKRANPNAKTPPTLDSKFEELVKIRNKLAHRMFYKDENEILNFDGKNITIDSKVIKSGNWDLDELVLSEEKVKELNKNARYIQQCMIDLLAEVEKAKPKDDDTTKNS